MVTLRRQQSGSHKYRKLIDKSSKEEQGNHAEPVGRLAGQRHLHGNRLRQYDCDSSETQSVR